MKYLRWADHLTSPVASKTHRVNESSFVMKLSAKSAESVVLQV